MVGPRGFPGGAVVKNPPASAGDVGSIHGLKRSPEKEMATIPVYLPGKISWTEKPGRLQFIGLQRVGHDYAPEHSRTQ